MKTSEYLFELIKSLNKNEKGYFKKLNSFHVRGEKNNYMKLFDVIEKQKEYDEKGVTNNFKGEDLVNNFSVAKAYLYELILKSLRSFYSSFTLDSEIQNLFHQTEILFRKAAYGQCQKILKKAKQLCTAHDRFELLLTLLKWEQKLLVATTPVTVSYKEDKIILEQTQIVINKISNIAAYRLLYNRVFTLAFKYGYNAPPKKEMHELNSIKSDTLLKNESCALSYAAEIQYHSIYCIFFILTGKNKQCYEHRKKHMELLEFRPELISENPLSYFHVLNALFIDSHKLNKFDELPQIIEKLKAVPKRYSTANNESLNLAAFSYSYTAELALYIEIGAFEKGLQLIPEIEKGLIKYEGKISKRHEMLFFSSFANINFSTGNYKNALHWVNKMLDIPSKGNPENMQSFVRFARMFNLFVHYELGNDELLEYIIKSTQRFYTLENKLYQQEKILLDFFRKIITVHSQKQKTAVFKALKQTIEKLLNNPLQKTVLERFELVSWIESKIENRSFAGILKEKALQKIKHGKLVR